MSLSRGRATPHRTSVPNMLRFACSFFVLALAKVSSENQTEAAPESQLLQVAASGWPVPRWAAYSDTGSWVTANAHSGKRYLLWWYPKADSPGCLAEGLRFKALHGEFQKLGVTLIGASPNTVGDNNKYHKKYGFPFTLLCDPQFTIPQAFSTGSIRWAALIGPDGTVEQFAADVRPQSFPDQALYYIKTSLSGRFGTVNEASLAEESAELFQEAQLGDTLASSVKQNDTVRAASKSLRGSAQKETLAQSAETVIPASVASTPPEAPSSEPVVALDKLDYYYDGDGFTPWWGAKNDDGRFTTASQYFGRRLLLWWYPKADSPGCLEEALRFKDLAPRFAQQGVTILGASPNTVEYNHEYRLKHNFPFSLLCDPSFSVPKAFYTNTMRWAALVSEGGAMEHFFTYLQPQDFPDDALAYILAHPATPPGQGTGGGDGWNSMNNTLVQP